MVSTYDFFGYLATGFLVLFVIDFTMGRNWVRSTDVPLGISLLALVTAYVLGHILAHSSSAILEDFFLRKILGSPEEHMFTVSSSSIYRFVFPYNFKALPEETQIRVREKAEKAGIKTVGRGLFFHCHAKVKTIPVVSELLNQFFELVRICKKYVHGISCLSTHSFLRGARIRDVHL